MVKRNTKSAEIIRNHTEHDEDQWFVEAIGTEWYKHYVESGQTHKPFSVEGARWRASWAGMCARRIAYSVAKIEESDPPSATDAWRFKIGSLAHEEIQAVVNRLFPDSQVEMAVKIDKHGAGSIDLYIVLPDGTTYLIELKTIGSTGWGGLFPSTKDESGAKYQAIMQGAVSAAALGDRQPDYLMVAYWSLEPAQEWRRRSLGMPDSDFGRFSAQWTFSKEEYLQIAEEEIDRMERIVELVDEEPNGWQMVPRVIPDPWKPRHEIVDPAASQYRERNGAGWVKKLVKTWECNYCPFQSFCADAIEREIAAQTEQAVQAVVLAFPGATEVEDEASPA
jgi:hypothetical protein